MSQTFFGPQRESLLGCSYGPPRGGYIRGAIYDDDHDSSDSDDDHEDDQEDHNALHGTRFQISEDYDSFAYL